MPCPHCAHSTSPTDRYCGCCGAALSHDAAGPSGAELSAAERRDAPAQAVGLATPDQITAGFIHELNQPLTALHLYAESALALRAASNSPELLDCLRRIEEQARRAGELVRRMRRFGGGGSTSPHEPLDLRATVDEALDLLHDELRSAGIQPQVRIDEPLPFVVADAAQICRVLVHFIYYALNAVRTVPVERRRLGVSVESDASCVRVSVSGGEIETGIAPPKDPTLSFTLPIAAEHGAT